MNILKILLLINYVIVIFEVIAMIIRNDKKPIRVFAWTIILWGIPFLGLMVYIYVGKGINDSTKRMLKKRKLKNEEYDKLLQQEVEIFKHSKLGQLESKRKELILLNLKNCGSLYTKNNSVEYFIDGKEMLLNLKKDLMNATKTINIMFYIFAKDKTGKEIRDILTEKAKQGVKVKVIYDAIGSNKTNRRFFKQLIKAGGEVEPFFPSMLGISLLNVYVNYRNHRKIVIIDGKIGYTGGMNLRDDHMGLHKKLTPWRDTHLKIIGPSVHALQNIFIGDWRFVNKKYLPANLYTNSNYYAPIEDFDKQENVSVQIISSSPVTKNQTIKDCLLKMIMSAKQKIRIQTPYFIPDDFFLGTIHLALLSGVKVELMIPKIADHKTVWYATLSYVQNLKEMGADVYFYKGFLHSKTLSVDDKVVTIGTCNMDVRSFALNFEVNAVLYGTDITKKHNDIFEQDKLNCEFVDNSYFRQMRLLSKLKMRICKLFSSIF